MRREFAILALGFGFDRRKIQNDQYRDKFALVAHHDGIANVRAGLQHIFDRRRRDEFPSGGLQQFLLAVGDDQITVCVELPDVAGAKPTVVRQYFARLGGLAVVPLHYVRAFHQNLAIFRDAHLHVRDRTPHRADLVRGGQVRSNYRRGFRQAVALKHAHIQRPEEFREFRREGRTSGTEGANSSAQARANFRKDQPVRDSPPQLQAAGRFLPVSAPGHRFLRHAQGPIENPALQARLAMPLLQYARVYLLEKSRHGRGHGGTHFQQRLRYGFDLFEVGNRDAARQIAVAEGALVHVSERQKFQRHVIRLKYIFLQRVNRIGAEIRVIQHHALGFARRSRGVDDRRQLSAGNVRGAAPEFRDVRFAGRGDQRLITQNFAVQVAGRRDRNHMLQPGDARTRFGNLAGLRFALGDHNPRARIVQDVRQPVRGLIEINGHAGGAQSGDREIRDVPFRAIRREDAHAIAGLDAELAERFREARHAAQHFAGGDGLPTVRGLVHLRFRIGVAIYGVQKKFVQRGIVHVFSINSSV